MTEAMKARTRCPHIQVVFDYFHIKKSFNENVPNEIKKDEMKRIVSEGKKDEAASLKRTKYILCSSRKTLAKKDEKAAKMAGVEQKCLLSLMYQPASFRRPS